MFPWVILVILLVIVVACYVVKRFRKFRFMMIEREYFALWSTLVSEEKVRLLSVCYPEEKLPDSDDGLDELFAAFIRQRWQELEEEDMCDFETWRKYLDKLMAYASGTSSTSPSHIDSLH